MSYSEESIKQWSERDVGLWLSEAGLRDCVPEFKSLQITGVRLLLLGPDDLKSFSCLKGNEKRKKAVKKALGNLPGNSMVPSGKKKFGKFAKKEPMMRRPIQQQNQSQPPLPPPPPGAPPLPSRPGEQPNAPPLPSRPGAPHLPPRGFEQEQDVYEAFDEDNFADQPPESFDADDDSFDEEDESQGGQTGFFDIEAKFRAFGIGGPSRVPQEEDDFGDCGEDIYDMPPDEVLPTTGPGQGEDSEDEPSDIYDLPPDSEMMQIQAGLGSQFPPPPPPPPPQNMPLPYIEARGQAQSLEDIYEMEDPGPAEGIYEMQDEETEDIYDIADEDEFPAPARPPKPGAGGPMSRPVMRPPLKSPRSMSPERGSQESEPPINQSKSVMPEYLRERFAKAKNRPNTSGSSMAPSNQVSGSSIEPEPPSPPMGRAPMPLPPRDPHPPSPPPIERGPPRLPPKEFGEISDRPPARPPKESSGPPGLPPKESPLPPRRMDESVDGPPQLPPKEPGLGIGVPMRPPKPGSPMMERKELRAPSPGASRKSPMPSPALQRPPKPAGLSREESPQLPRAQKPPPSPQTSHRPIPPAPEEESPEPVAPILRQKSTSPDPSKQIKRRSSGKIADLMARFEQPSEDSHPPTKPKPNIAKRWPPVQQEETHKPTLPSKPGPPAKPQLPEKDTKPPPPTKPSRSFPLPSELPAKPSPPSSPVFRKPPIPPKSDAASPHIPRKEAHNISGMNSYNVHVGGSGGVDSRPAHPTPKERMRSPSPAQTPPSLPDKPSLGGDAPPRLPDRPQLHPPADKPPPPIPGELPSLDIFREMKPRTSGFPPPVARPPAPPPEDKPLPPVPPVASLPSPVHNDRGLGRAPPPLPPPAASPDDISDQLWYHGNIDRSEVQRRLGIVHKDGCFLVRAAQKGEGYSLSLWYGGQPRHLRIRKREDNLYAVGEKKESEVAFPNILELVAHHAREPLVLKSGGQTLLAHVCPKT